MQNSSAVGGPESKLMSDKSNSPAADIWLSQRENKDISESDVRSLTPGSLFIVRRFSFCNHNRIGLVGVPRQTLCVRL